MVMEDLFEVKRERGMEPGHVLVFVVWTALVVIFWWMERGLEYN
jgi:hypothetical protein